MRIRFVVLALVAAACPDKPSSDDTDATTSSSTVASNSSATDATSTGTTSTSGPGPITLTTLTTPGSTTDGPTTTDGPGTSTTGDLPPGILGACQPIDGDLDCGIGQTCCSDDPATVGGKLPNYYMDGVNDDKYGTPIFSDINNDLSHWGFCIETGGFSSPLVNGCPVPCNPRWEPARIAEICGGTNQCCSFTDIDPNKDCIFADGRWRTAVGQDVLDGLTMWGSAHATNQDPNGVSCKQFATGAPGQEPMGPEQNAAFGDCIRQLTVADQRGFCYAFGCPCKEDPCDMKNPDWVPRCG